MSATPYGDDATGRVLQVEELGELAASVLADALAEAAHALAELEQAADLGAAHLASQDEGVGALAAAAMVQDLRRGLARAEASILREVGPLTRRGSLDKAGQLPDGRPYELLRGADRKAWKHEDWQHDARQAVLGMYADVQVVDPATGVIVSGEPWLQGAVTAVQQVHGSTAPRTRELRKLGLDPDDYAETVPGSWSLRVTG